MATPPTATEIMKESDNMDMKMMLSISALQGDWKEVVEKYQTCETARTIEIIGGRGTVLHVAVNDGLQDIVKVLLESIKEEDEQLQVLGMRDERGDTPLHLAASKGFKGICKLIIGPNEERNKLITIKNNLGETPLFLAAHSWQKQTFAYLLYVFKNYANSEADQTNRDVIDLQVLMREDGDTILHSAIRSEFFDLAVIIIHYCPKLHDIQNAKGFTPLKLLANKPSAFRSGSMLSWTWSKRIIYHCIEVKDLDVQRTLEEYLNYEYEDLVRLPPNYVTCYEFFTVSELAGLGGCNIILPSEKVNRQRLALEPNISIPFPKPDTETSQSHSPERKSKKSLVPEMQFKEVQNVLLPPNYATFEWLVKWACLYAALGISGRGKRVKVIRKLKRKHKLADHLLRALMQNPSQAYMGSGGQPIEQLEDNVEDKDANPNLDPFSADTRQRDPEAEENIDRKETAFLIAAKNGIVEIVKVILFLIPGALYDTTSDKKNIFHVAIKYRQPLVVQALQHNLSDENIKNLIRAVDKDENTVVHLAAKALSIETPWKISGSILQMMWDISWFEYIKGLVPNHFIYRRNGDGKTSGEIFKESHKDLLKESNEWLKKTSESCSVVAALVAGVTFATSGAVPGGTEKGKPVLEGQLAFRAFGISSLIGLCFSVTALIMFLTIITSKNKAKDFRTNLPLKLFLGLLTLFISIVAMFISFCAGHFFVLKDMYWQIVFPVYVVTCLPISFYSMAQFPLFLDLLRAISKTLPRRDEGADDL